MNKMALMNKDEIITLYNNTAKSLKPLFCNILNNHNIAEYLNCELRANYASHIFMRLLIIMF